MNSTSTTPILPVSVAYSHSLHEALAEAGCVSPSDYTVLPMPGNYGDCLIIHTHKAFFLWDSLPKNHPDKCAAGYGKGSGMYIRN